MPVTGLEPVEGQEPQKRYDLLSIDNGKLVIDTDALEEGIKSSTISSGADLEKICSDADEKGDCSDEPVKIDKLSDDALKSKHLPAPIL